MDKPPDHSKESVERFRRIVSSPENRVCPFLGSQRDPATHLSYPSSGNRCYAPKRETRIAKDTQEILCLKPQHLLCEIYQSARVKHSGKRE
jgi:hypothetical protein